MDAYSQYVAAVNDLNYLSLYSNASLFWMSQVEKQFFTLSLILTQRNSALFLQLVLCIKLQSVQIIIFLIIRFVLHLGDPGNRRS